MKRETLNKKETVLALEKTKNYFEKQLSTRLNLIKVLAPLYVEKNTGLQDQLSGIEKAVSFKTKDGTDYEIVHSLAKWKRMALKKYDFQEYEGIYTDMKAIRKQEDVDNIHSYFVEQWDWERIIKKEDRSVDTLKKTVNLIYSAIKQTNKYIKKMYPKIKLELPRSVYFVTSQDLEDMYPNNSPKEREEIITKEKKAVFIIGIGDKLKSGIEHDLRSPDYDDWSLDGDLLIYSNVINKPIEITSMGIRVDEKSLLSQLEKSNSTDRLVNQYHSMILNCELPYTIGGGIGQSRLFMLLLEKENIKDVQAN